MVRDFQCHGTAGPRSFKVRVDGEIPIEEDRTFLFSGTASGEQVVVYGKFESDSTASGQIAYGQGRVTLFLWKAKLVTLTAGSTPTLAASPTDRGGCPTYTVQTGDLATSIATRFGVSLADLMRANQLTEADLTQLQIGQVLIIPVNGCRLATGEASPTPTRFVLPSLPATVTAMPVASKALIEIVQVISPGDITAEGIELRNVSGGVILMQGWKLSDSSGHTFTFPEYRMFPGGRVMIYTRAGTNFPIALFWGQSRAIWGDPGQVVQITDVTGSIQASRPVSGAAATAGTPDASAGNGFSFAEVVTAKVIDSSNCAANKISTFSVSDPRIYVIADIRNFKSGTSVAVKWSGTDFSRDDTL